ncbi:MAG: hypothetical protein Q7T36_16035 [Fluviicoccus sp.]|uniref:hypothetical protein n=1 Tax=Fluviicoccus sp. TaxID=2003552 RepID=UPI0027257063|nr:hypothetical protein [Fluviicoccus sp.]MDO8331975.1 hypothetical protein [Fluviicoccus sp.]
MPTHHLRYLALLPMTLLLAPAVQAESLTDFQRAQDNKNSYEANRESRQRNSQDIQLQQVPVPGANDSGKPRSSDEVQAEHERKMQAMHDKWADRRSEEQKLSDQQKAQNAYYAKQREKYAEDERFEKEELADFMKKARKIALKGPEKWLKFVNKQDTRERSVLKGVMGYRSNLESPMADLGRKAYYGLDGEMSDPAAAEQLWQRGADIMDGWSMLNLGRLHASRGDPEGLTTAYKYFNQCRLSSQYSAPKEICALEVSRADAFGLGTTPSIRYALKLFYDKSYDDSTPVEKRDQAWIDSKILYSEFRRTGVDFGPDSALADSMLRKLVDPKNPQAWRALLALMKVDRDIDDKALSWQILDAAYKAGWREVSGELALKLLKGEGTAANTEAGFAMAMAQPRLTPETTMRLGRQLITAGAPTKAAALITRFAPKEHAGLTALLTEANSATK